MPDKIYHSRSICQDKILFTVRIYVGDNKMKHPGIRGDLVRVGVSYLIGIETLQRSRE